MSKIGERIAKTIANTGSCSRRDAEKWILGGRVKVNGVVINSPALNVTETDIILIDDKLIPKGNPIRLWKFHKPVGYITSHKDPQHRPTLFSLLPPDFPRVISVGRLDMDSQGLILLTNNGEIAHKLENPSLGIPKKYRIRVRGTIDQRILDDLKQGIKIDDFQYKPADAQLEKQDGKFA